MTMEMMNWTKKNSKPLLLALITVCLVSCRTSNRDTVIDTAKLLEQNDSLSTRIHELEEQNQALDERVTDLEKDLEDVITFLGNELGF